MWGNGKRRAKVRAVPRARSGLHDLHGLRKTLFDVIDQVCRERFAYSKSFLASFIETKIETDSA